MPATSIALVLLMMLVSLLVMEPDFGQTMLILMVWGSLFFIAGMRMIWVAGLAGAAGAGLLPAANGLFVRALPMGYRARAFGVMQTGMQLLQGASVLVTGVLASYFALPSVVGWWSVGGVALLVLVVALWPAPSVFARTVEQAQQANTGFEANGSGGADTGAVDPAGAPEAPAPRPRPADDPSNGRIRTAGQL
jgi:MFS family permease